MDTPTPATTEGSSNFPLGTPRPGPTKRLQYSHKVMADLLIAQPGVSNNEIAALFGFTPAWVSQVKNGDMFQAYLKEREKELVDPLLIATVEERLGAVAKASLDRVAELLPQADIEQATEVMKVATQRMGLGVVKNAAPGSGVQVIIQVPPKAGSAEDWAARHAPPAEEVIENAVEVVSDIPEVDHENPPQV